MNWVDLVIVAAVLGAAFLGFKIGLLRAAFLFGAFILGAVIGARVSVLLDTLLEKLIEDPDVRDIATFTGAFVLVFLGVNAFGSIVCRVVSFTPFRWIDQWIGSVLGFLAGIMLVGLAIMYLTKSSVSGSEEWLKESSLVPIIKTITSPILRELLEKKSLVPFETVRYQLSACFWLDVDC
jgi:uncharacterized membrane protein required for colicin V production